MAARCAFVSSGFSSILCFDSARFDSFDLFASDDIPRLRALDRSSFVQEIPVHQYRRLLPGLMLTALLAAHIECSDRLPYETGALHGTFCIRRADNVRICCFQVIIIVIVLSVKSFMQPFSHPVHSIRSIARLPVHWYLYKISRSPPGREPRRLVASS